MVNRQMLLLVVLQAVILVAVQALLGLFHKRHWIMGMAIFANQMSFSRSVLPRSLRSGRQYNRKCCMLKTV